MKKQKIDIVSYTWRNGTAFLLRLTEKCLYRITPYALYAANPKLPKIKFSPLTTTTKLAKLEDYYADTVTELLDTSERIYLSYRKLKSI